MNKKYTLLILIVTLFVSSFTYGQRKPDRERIKTLKIAYITERLDLSTKEAEAFWPIYNKHEATMDALRKRERTQIRGKRVDIASLSEKEAETMLNKMLVIEQEKSDELIGFIQNVSTVLSAQKTLSLVKAEEDFKRRLLKEMRSKRRN